jgi:hypothetical protein
VFENMEAIWLQIWVAIEAISPEIELEEAITLFTHHRKAFFLFHSVHV